MYWVDYSDFLWGILEGGGNLGEYKGGVYERRGIKGGI
jgi:hypothetical protein